MKIDNSLIIACAMSFLAIMAVAEVAKTDPAPSMFKNGIYVGLSKGLPQN